MERHDSGYLLRFTMGILGITINGSCISVTNYPLSENNMGTVLLQKEVLLIPIGNHVWESERAAKCTPLALLEFAALGFPLCLPSLSEIEYILQWYNGFYTS
jgi:hypothetical protein